MKYEVKQNGKKWEIVRIKDGIAIDSWDKEYLARNRLVAIEALNKAWDKQNEEKQAAKKQRQSKI